MALPNRFSLLTHWMRREGLHSRKQQSNRYPENRDDDGQLDERRILGADELGNHDRITSTVREYSAA
jgi:hypothetical protein